MSFRTAYGNTHSENGWRMVNRDECDLVRIPELYLTETAPLRKGAPLVILGAWLYWYDRNVEEIATSVWGWSATNDVANSNHLSGTAVDLNAPKYPWGVDASANMSNEKIAKIRYGMKLFEGSVYWGQDWSKRDPMHFQMAWREGDARNEAFADKLRSGYLGIYKPATTTPEAPVPLTDSQKIDYIYRQLQPWPQLGKNDKGQSLTLVDAVSKALGMLTTIGSVVGKIASKLGA